MQVDKVYLKLEKDIEIEASDVYLKDIGKVYCFNEDILNRCKCIKIVKFKEGEQTRKIIGVLKILEIIHRELPKLEIENMGETDVIIEKVKNKKVNKIVEYMKIIFVSAISFFGTAFTIMAFHNDSGIRDIFDELYYLIMGEQAEGYSVLEVSYSIGLAVGIIIFFNHVGNRRITKDPTPIEVEMRNYEREVNDALIETADREGINIDVM